MESEITALREAIKSEDAERIRTSMESVSKIWHEASAQMYAQAQQQGGAGTGGGPGGPAGGAGAAGGETDQAGGKGGKDDVVDADFEVVDDNK